MTPAAWPDLRELENSPRDNENHMRHPWPALCVPGTTPKASSLDFWSASLVQSAGIAALLCPGQLPVLILLPFLGSALFPSSGNAPIS